MHFAKLALKHLRMEKSGLSNFLGGGTAATAAEVGRRLGSVREVPFPDKPGGFEI